MPTDLTAENAENAERNNESLFFKKEYLFYSAFSAFSAVKVFSVLWRRPHLTSKYSTSAPSIMKYAIRTPLAA